MNLTPGEFQELLSHALTYGLFSRDERDESGFGITRTYNAHRLEGDEFGLCVRTMPFNTVELFKLSFTPARPSFMGLIPATMSVLRVRSAVVKDDSDLDESSDDDMSTAKNARPRLGK